MPLGKGCLYEQGEKIKTPSLEKHYSTVIGSSNVKMVADRHRHAA